MNRRPREPELRVRQPSRGGAAAYCVSDEMKRHRCKRPTRLDSPRMRHRRRFE